MTNRPARIVFEGPHGFEIDQPAAIELVLDVAERLKMTPEEAIKLALVQQVDGDPELRNEPEIRRLADALRP